jgi:hypothetical protein
LTEKQCFTIGIEQTSFILALETVSVCTIEFQKNPFNVEIEVKTVQCNFHPIVLERVSIDKFYIGRVSSQASPWFKGGTMFTGHPDELPRFFREE